MNQRKPGETDNFTCWTVECGVERTFPFHTTLSVGGFAGLDWTFSELRLRRKMANVVPCRTLGLDTGVARL